MKKLLICILISVLSPSVLLAGELPTCVNDTNDFNCFQQNFKNIYQQDYDLFWDQWRNFEKQAMACTSLDETKNFLSLVVYGDGEVGEAFGMAGEQLILANPHCFLAAAEQSDSSYLYKSVRNLVFAPLFHQCTEMVPVVEKALSTGKYPRVQSVFIQMGCGS